MHLLMILINAEQVMVLPSRFDCCLFDNSSRFMNMIMVMIVVHRDHEQNHVHGNQQLPVHLSMQYVIAMQALTSVDKFLHQLYHHYYLHNRSQIDF